MQKDDGGFDTGRRAEIRRTVTLALAAALALGCGDGNGPPGPEEPRADVTVTVTGPETGEVGAELVHTVRVANGGPAAAEDVEVSASVTGGSIVSASDGGTVSGGEVSWPAIAVVAAGASRTFTLTTRADEETDVRIIASSTSVTPDPAPSNNDGSGEESQAVVSVVGEADLVVSHSGPLTGLPGQEITLRVTVDNDGPSAAGDVEISLVLPPGAGFVSASDGGSATGGTVTWPMVGELAADASLLRTATVTVPSVGPAVATASASSATSDPTASNNDGSAPAARVRTLVIFETLYTLTGEAAGDEFGFLMEHLGDVDADGVSDFVVTAPSHAASAGKAYVYSGATGAELFTLTGGAGEQLGFGVDLAGDIDADGVPDVITGGPGTGTVRIHSGADGSEIRVIQGPAGASFGFSVGRAGDVDGDGRDDVAVGAILASAAGQGAGRVYVYSGVDGSLLFTHDPAVAGAALGAAVSGPGDLNGDGLGDILAGAPDTQGGGRIYVISGADGSALYPSIAPDATGSKLGQFWLESPGDLNGDGVPDIFGSDIENAAGGANTGRAYIWSGVDGSLVWEATGDEAGSQFGIGRGANADADGDGVRDVFVAAWLHDEGGNQAGKAYLLSGVDGNVLRTFTHRTAMDRLGYDAVGVGDLDGDGRPDYLLSGGLSSGPGKVLVVKGTPLD